MKRLLLILLILPLLTSVAYAMDESGGFGDSMDVSAAEESLPGNIRDLTGPLRVDGDYDSVGALERLWNGLLKSFGESFRSGVRDALAVLGVIVLSCLAAAFAEGQKLSEYVQIGACCAVSCLLCDGMGSMIGSAEASLITLSDYGKLVLPCIYTLAGTSGAPGSASAGYAASCFAMEAMMSLSKRLILPLIYACLAMSISVSIYQSPMLRSMLNLGKKLCVLAMTIMSTAFSAIIGLAGVVSRSADAAAARAVGTAIKFALPVVGRLMTDAAASVISAASLIKNSVGVFGLIAVCALCISPFALFAARRVLFILLGAAAEWTVGERLSRLLGDLSSLMGMLLGLIGSFGLMLFFALVSAIRTVGG